MSKKKKKNLIPFNERTEDELKEIAKRGGIKSGEVRRARKTLKQELLALLSNDKMQEKISTALIEKASKGNTKAFEVIRDTIGEKPTEKLEAQNTNANVEITNTSVIEAVIKKLKDL